MQALRYVHPVIVSIAYKFDQFSPFVSLIRLSSRLVSMLLLDRDVKWQALTVTSSSDYSAGRALECRRAHSSHNNTVTSDSDELATDSRGTQASHPWPISVFILTFNTAILEHGPNFTPVLIHTLTHELLYVHNDHRCVRCGVQQRTRWQIQDKTGQTTPITVWVCQSFH